MRKDLPEPNTDKYATPLRITTSTGRHPYDIIVGKHSEEHYDTVVFYLLRIPLLILFTPVYWLHVLQQLATVIIVVTMETTQCGEMAGAHISFMFECIFLFYY